MKLPAGTGDTAGWDFDDEDYDLKEGFGLPDRLPAMRLPAEDELAAMARNSPLLGRVSRLAEWAGAGRAVTEDGELTAGDVAEAARELGNKISDLAVEGTLPGMPAAPDVTSMRDVPELVDLWSLAGKEGLFFAEASDVIRSAAVAELSAVKGMKAWESWTRAHGDPADLLFGRLAQLGAVTVDAASGATAAEGMNEEEVAAETDAWLARRAPDVAARELYELAAKGGSMERMVAITAVSRLGAAAEPMWRDALDVRELTLIGKHHPDRKVAKAPRRSAYRASGRLKSAR